MQIIAVVTQKGGAGKSTLCQELAVCAEQHGHKVAIIDFDRQGSITQWAKDRPTETPVVISAADKNLGDFVQIARDKDYDFLFIDTTGKDDPTPYEAMQAADLCLVPTRARKKDIFPARANVEASLKLKKDLVFILNHTPPVFRRDLQERTQALTAYGTLCPATVGHRVDFQDADDQGLTVLELKPQGKAATEIRQLWNWLDQYLRKTTNPSL